MARVNVYLPDELAEQVRQLDISVSPVCQRALEQEVRKVQATNDVGSGLEQVAARLRQTREDKERREYQDGYEIGVRWAKEIATETELDWAQSVASEHWMYLSLEGGGESSLLDLLYEVADGWDADYDPGTGEYVRVEREPFIVGILEGAAEVYRKVTPLL